MRILAVVFFWTFHSILLTFILPDHDVGLAQTIFSLTGRLMNICCCTSKNNYSLVVVPRTHRAASPKNNEPSAELTTANDGTFSSSSARLSSQSRYSTLDQ